MESNSDDDNEDTSPSLPGESKPKERRGIMSQIAERQATQQAASDQQHNASRFSSAIRGYNPYQESNLYENIGDRREVPGDSLVTEDESDTERDVYVTPFKWGPPTVPPKPVKEPSPVPDTASENDSQDKGGSITSQEYGSTNVLSKEERSTNIPSKAEGNANIPSQEQDSSTIPSQEEESTNILSKEEEGTSILSKEEGNTSIPSQEQDSSSIPSKEEANANIPSQEQESIKMPSQTQEEDNIIPPLKEEKNTMVTSPKDDQNIDSTTGVQTGPQTKVVNSEKDIKEDVKAGKTGKPKTPPEVPSKSFKFQSQPFKFIVDGGSIQNRSKSEERVIPKKPHVDSQTSTEKGSSKVISEKRKSVQNLLQMFEKSKPDQQQVKPVTHSRISKSLSPEKERQLSITSKDIPDISKTEDTSKTPSQDKDTFQTAAPEKDVSNRKHDTAVETPVKPEKEMNTERDDDDDYETAEEDQDDEEEEPSSVVVSGDIGGATVSTSPHHLEKSVDHLTPSKETEFSDSHVSLKSDTSEILGSDNVEVLTRTNIISGSTASSIQSDVGQPQSHPTLQPMTHQHVVSETGLPQTSVELQHQQGHFIPQPTVQYEQRQMSTAPMIRAGVQKGEEDNVSNFTSPTEGMPQQMQQRGYTNTEHDDIQQTRGVPNFQRQFPDQVKQEEPLQVYTVPPEHQHLYHREPAQGHFIQGDPYHGQQAYPEEPIQNRPMQADPHHGQQVYHEEPMQSLPMQADPHHGQHIYPEEPMQSLPMQADPHHVQAKQEEFPHQQVHQEQFQGQHQYQGHPLHPNQFQGQWYHHPEQQQYAWQQMEGQNWPGHQGFAGQQHQQTHEHQFHGMYNPMYPPHQMGQEYYPQGHQKPQDLQPKKPADPQETKVNKSKEKTGAKQPRKTKPAAKPPKTTPNPDQTAPKTDKKEKKEVPKPKKLQKSYVCVKGLNEDTGLDTLWLFLENRSGCDVDKSSVLYSNNKTMAVATLLESPTSTFNFQEFKTKCLKKKLEGAIIKVCEVAPPVAVIVSSEQRMPSEHEMKKHFQQEKFGWVKVRRMKMTDDGCCRVEFKDNAALQKICHSPYSHKIGSANLCVTPLYVCDFGEIWEEDKHKVCIPENITLKHTHHHKMDLIKKYESVKELLQSELKTKHAKVKVTDQLHIECTMDQNTKGVRGLVRLWESEVIKIWETFIGETVQQMELLITSEVWSDLFGHLKEHQDHKTVHLHYQNHDEDVKLVVVGVETMFSTVTETIHTHKDRIEKAIERKKQITTVTKEFKPLEIRLLNQLDILTQVNGLAEDLNVIDNEESGTITFNGVDEDIKTAETIILDQTIQFRLWTIQEDNVTSKDQVKLLQNQQLQGQLKEKFAEHKLVVELECSTSGLQVGTESANTEQNVRRIIDDTVTYRDVPLTETEKIDVLSTFSWKQQCQQIEEDNNGLVIISTILDYGFKVTSIETIHQDVLQQLLTFIDEKAIFKGRYNISDEGKMKFFKKHYSREIKDMRRDLSDLSVTVEMEDSGLALTGTRQGMKQAKDRLTTLENDIKSKQHDIKRLGIVTIVNPDNADMFSGIESDTNTIVMQHETFIQSSGSQGSSDEEEEEDLFGTEESYTWGRTGMTGKIPKAEAVAPQPPPVKLRSAQQDGITCKNGLKIKLLHGEIGKEKADVLVVSTSKDLVLDKAGAGKSLVKYGGPGLQAELKANHPAKINPGDIITIGPGTLRCKQVFLCNLPELEKDQNSKPVVLTKVILESLTKAARAGYSTVKFVAMGTGALKYPAQTVAEMMYDAVHQYDAKGTSSLLLVTFVLYPGDHRTISAFEDEEYTRLHPGHQTQFTGVRGPYDTKHGVKITLVKGLMDKQTVDVIACMTSKNLDMSGGVATALSKAAGSDLIQADCKAKYPSGIDFGEVAVITNGNLKTCKSIYLSSLPGWKNQDGSRRNDVEKLLSKAVTTCLQKVAQSGMKSIAFPAIGTGQIGYPRDTVAKLMYDYVIDFAAKNVGTSLTDVRFVLYQRDRETIHSFEKEEQMRLSPSRTYSSGPLQSFYTKGNKVQVSIETCSIADFQKADVIAATVSDDLDLTKGGAMSAISKNGGVTLKAECDVKYPKGIKVGDLAELSPGNLSCKALYLGTLPSYSNGPAEAEKALDRYIWKVLDTASSKGYTTVAFPAVGTGFNSYPHTRAATLCYEAVQHFDRKKSSIKTVYFVILQKDIPSLNAFQREERKRNHRPVGLDTSDLGAVGGFSKKGTYMRVFSKRDDDAAMRPQRHTTRSKRLDYFKRRSDKRTADRNLLFTLSAGSGCMSIQGGKTNQFVYGKVTLQVNVENIVKLKDPVDVIVNSTNKQLDFSIGGVSTELMKICDPKQLKDECEKKKTEMERTGMICTSGCGLSCKAILHVEAQNSLAGWRKKILACLQEVDNQGHKSIAFPAFGTGGGGVQFNPEEIAKTLHESLQHFCNNSSSITLVRLVIFDQKKLWSMQKVFRDNIQKPSTAVADDYSVVQGRTTTPDLSHVSLWILGTTDFNINEAIDRIGKLIDKKYSVKPINDTLIAQLDDNEVKEIEKLSKQFLVEVKVDRQGSVVELDGPLDEVGNVTQEVHRLISHFNRERFLDSEAEFIAGMVQWFYKEIDSSGSPKLSEYPPRNNMGLENSRKGNHPTYKFRANEEDYVVDLLTMKEASVKDPTDTADVIRREKQEGGQFELPADWAEMHDQTEMVKVVPLASSSQQYQDIETKFQKSVLNGQYSSQFNAAKLKVHKIERVQNRSLFHQYSIKKALLDQKNPQGTTNEQMLWHGTGSAAITSINYYGFNRSYCGGDPKKGECWYGAGVYFANDASYSARDWVSVPSNQKKSMYLCRVLTGIFCKADKNMRYLPPLPNNPSENYDSAVQPLINPMEFVIFNDTQAYPEFLITFSTT